MNQNALLLVSYALINWAGLRVIGTVFRGRGGGHTYPEVGPRPAHGTPHTTPGGEQPGVGTAVDRAYVPRRRPGVRPQHP